MPLRRGALSRLGALTTRGGRRFADIGKAERAASPESAHPRACQKAKGGCLGCPKSSLAQPK